MKAEENFRVVDLCEVPFCATVLAYWSYFQWYRERDIPFRANVEAYRQRAAGKKLPLAFVALFGDFPVGMVSLKENDLWSRKDLNPWLASLYVHPEYRGRGISTILCEKVIEKAALCGYKAVYLFLDHNDLSFLKNMYTARGWHFYEKAIDNDGHSTEIYRYLIAQ